MYFPIGPESIVPFGFIQIGSVNLISNIWILIETCDIQISDNE